MRFSYGLAVLFNTEEKRIYKAILLLRVSLEATRAIPLIDCAATGKAVIVKTVTISIDRGSTIDDESIDVGIP